MSILPNLVYIFNIISAEIPASYVVDIDKIILKFTWKIKRPRITKTIPKKKNKIRGFIIPDFKTAMVV